MLLLPKNLEVLERLTADATGTVSRAFPGMTGVRVRVTEEGYRAEATNGKVLGIVTGPAVSPEDFPASAIPPAASDTAAEGVVPGGAWKEAFKGLPRRPPVPALGQVAALLGPEGTTLVTTDGDAVTVTEAPVSDGRFPDVEAAFPRGAPVARFAVDPVLLRTLLGVAEAFAGQEGTRRVVFEVRMPKGGAALPLQPVQVSARNEAGQEFRGLIMPLAH
jgi:hypothetical protein